MAKIKKFEGYLALDQQYISALQFDSLSAKAVEVSQLLSEFIKCLKQSDLLGNKYP